MRVLGVGLVLWVASLLGACGPSATSPGEAVPSDEDSFAILGGDADAAYSRVVEARPFAFPDDHGEHPRYQIEWWYFTGNLTAAGDPTRRFGFELTFFRIALTAEPAARTSEWAADQLYMAHFAITDAAAQRFHFGDRLSRGAAGLAGVTSESWRLWNEGWSASSVVGESPDIDRANATAPDGIFPVRLAARDRDDTGAFALDLTLRPTQPMVLHGDRGYSRKGDEPGNASFYYSFTRLAAEGSVETPAGRFEVEGSAWMDHEWSTSVLGQDLAGWDWFALQLDDGTELMVFELRDADGQRAGHSQGTLITPDATIALTGDDFTLEVTDRWRSPTTQIVYPSGWRVRIPSRGVDVTVRPVIAAQELVLTTTYWEGAVDVFRSDGESVGRGYVELVGYTADER